MIVIGTKSELYERWRSTRSHGTHNGAYYYAKEIENIILPAIDADVFIVTAGGTLQSPNMIPDGAVVVCHNNQTPCQTYRKLFGKDILWICSKESTVQKIEQCGERAVYIPLSIDTEYVKEFKRKRKTKNTAFVGNAWKFKRQYIESLPPDIDKLSGMGRKKLLKEMSKYKKVIAEGRCNMEAQVLGCKVEIPDYQDPSIGAIPREVFDSRDAIPAWREVLSNHCESRGDVRILRCIKTFNDLLEKKSRRIGEVFSVEATRASQLIKNEHNIVELV